MPFIGRKNTLPSGPFFTHQTHQPRQLNISYTSQPAWISTNNSRKDSTGTQKHGGEGCIKSPTAATAADLSVLFELKQIFSPDLLFSLTQGIGTVEKDNRVFFHILGYMGRIALLQFFNHSLVIA